MILFLLGIIFISLKYEIQLKHYLGNKVNELKKKVDKILENEQFLSKQKLVDKLKQLQSSLLGFNTEILNDHLRFINLIKNFYTQRKTNDNNLKNLISIIQSSFVKNKNKELSVCLTEIEKQLSSSGGKDERKEKKNKTEIINNGILEINFLEKEEIKDKEEIKGKEEIQLLEIQKESLSHINFNEIDKNYIFNVKKKIMKTIFGIYFEKSFFYNETFEKMKKYYLNNFEDSKVETKLLNFPSKIKNYTNGLEIPLFLKENKHFFITKIFPITHEYFHQYMNKHNILSESIILRKNEISIPPNSMNNTEEKNNFECELVKLDRIYFGNIINSTKGEFILFKEKNFKIVDDENNLMEEMDKRIFSLSSLELIISKGEKKAKAEAKNNLLDEDIFPNEELNYNKSLLIFYSDIEEIIERRFLYMWQGIEIFLKNGKSYIFNMLNDDNYSNMVKSLKSNKNILFRKKDFLSKTPLITDNWRAKKLNTYQYLLFINKYGSRSLNDSSQYYIFPWILMDFSKLLLINEYEKVIYEYVKNKDEKIDINKVIEDEEQNNTNNNKEEITIPQLYNYLRKLRYPVSVQAKRNIENKILKYNDETEKFPHHFGTHYSTGPYIYYYLMRNEPFTSLLVILQSYSQENPDRMLLNLKDTLKIIDTGNDNRELIPEFFSKIDYFININCVFFGHKKNNIIVDDINQIWEDYNEKSYNLLSVYTKFIIEHQKLLNSKIIEVNIKNWIDNVFGAKQLPKKDREKSLNIFFKTAYEDVVNLKEKLKKYKIKENKNAAKRLVTKINAIVSFGQTPQKVFKNDHEKRDDSSEKIDTFVDDETDVAFEIMSKFKNENTKNYIKIDGIFFEINHLLGKIFILNKQSEISILHTNYYNITEQNSYEFKDNLKSNQLSNIYIFEQQKSDKNYIYEIKYAFSSFPKDNNSNSYIPYLYSNQYIMDEPKKEDNQISVENIKFITCKHLDNSFKIYHVIIDKKSQKMKSFDTFSYICEDFVMVCKAITFHSFIIGLKNGKLIKVIIREIKSQNKSTKKEENIKVTYKLSFKNYIQGHKGSINMIEFDKRNGIILTGGDDNKLCIRKVYDFELLTCIKIKSKFIITMAKISPKNFLYVLCYNKNKKKESYIIFGYTLSGLKFAKSNYSYYTNIEFTSNGNIITLINEEKVGILEAHNLNLMSRDNKNEDLVEIQKHLSKSQWFQYHDFLKYYGYERKSLTYLSFEDSKKKTYLKTSKVTDIPSFN